jgi:signal peptidase II
VSDAAPTSGPAARSPRAVAGRPAWGLFLGLAVAIVVIDQLSKAWVLSSVEEGSAVRLLGDLLRLINSRNTGALFGLFGSSAPVLAVASIVVIGLIVWFHARSGRNLLISIALGLLLGGAIGNLIDRVRLGYVVDWVDAGLGTLRFWTFNVGDAAISTSILLLLLIALVPGLGRASSDG